AGRRVLTSPAMALWNAGGIGVLVLGIALAVEVDALAAEWIASKNLGDASWVGIGYSTADGGLVLAIITTVLAWRATRRGAAGTGGPGALGRATVVLSGLLLIAYAVTLWAMTAKPA
ncbi:MAG: hypothetical protein QOH46_271, partial [Solirubrobacteraceae bacterium]|nr:hypothetical protein [Solirubrobacteraceae bacterium]